jgi:general secretion pathway protein D
LREGEVNILGGLSQDQNTRTLNGVPGLINIPILGRVLGGENTDRERGDLLIALIPHIVRTPNLSDVDLKGVMSGSDQVVRVSYAPRSAPPGTPVPAPGADKNAPTSPVTTPPTQTAPAVTQPTTPATPTPSGGTRLIFMPAAMQGGPGSPINLTIQAENVQDLFTASPIRVKWDPKVLRLNEIVPGELLARDNQRVTSAKDIRNDAGEAWITMNRLPGAGGVSSSGALATLQFVAIGKGNTSVTITEVGLKNTQLQPITVTAPEATVSIQ